LLCRALKGFETAWKSGHVKLDRVGGAAATTTDRTAILKQLVISVRIDKSCSINTFHPKQRIGTPLIDQLGDALDMSIHKMKINLDQEYIHRMKINLDQQHIETIGR